MSTSARQCTGRLWLWPASGISPARRRPTGFTLVELLVVITIIGILMSLLTPAINRARESARVTTCGSNLHAIGKALTLYHDAHECFPYGAYIYSTSGSGGGSSSISHNMGVMHFFLLPFLDATDLYNTYSPSSAISPTNTTASQSVGASSTVPMPVFVCPSDEFHGKNNTTCLTSYVASAGPLDRGTNNSGCTNQYRKWNYCFSGAPNGNPGYTTYHSAYTYNPKGTNGSIAYFNYVQLLGPFLYGGGPGAPPPLRTMASIRDGLSNTIFMGEVRPRCQNIALNNYWSSPYNGTGQISTTIPINYDSCGTPNNNDPCGQPANTITGYGFKSAHRGGANFLMGSESVHFLSENIDHQCYQLLGAIDDGFQVNPTDPVNPLPAF
jgi:prepilin-type N-terminal cleavage/methylation domain-containing protein